MSDEVVELTTAPGWRFPFPEATALFNPALGAVIVGAAVAGHEEESGVGLPWFASFLITPFALHDPTRFSLPRDIRTTMATWLSRNPAVADSFSRNTMALAPITRKAVRFALRSGIVRLDASLLSTDAGVRGLSGRGAAQLRGYANAARLAGRWIGRTDVLTAYSLLGVKL